MPTKLTLDVDAGTDDAIAIMLAVPHPELDLVACTTVFSTTAVAHCTENTLRMLELLDRSNIPVYEGAGHPIIPGRERDKPADPRSRSIHGCPPLYAPV